MPKARRKPRSDALDPVVMTVIANRLDGVVREMTNTPLRAARSAVISSARDFSCCILTGDNHLLASAEGLPVHIFGAHLQGENMCRYHRALSGVVCTIIVQRLCKGTYTAPRR